MKLTAIDIEKTLRCHLMACGVPASAIRLVRAVNADIVTVTVCAPHGTKVRDYSAFQLINGKPYVVDEMISIALWYHGGSIPEIKPSLSQRIISLPRRIIEGIVNQYRLYPVHVTILLLIQFFATFRIIQILWKGKV